MQSSGWFRNYWLGDKHRNQSCSHQADSATTDSVISKNQSWSHQLSATTDWVINKNQSCSHQADSATTDWVVSKNQSCSHQADSATTDWVINKNQSWSHQADSATTDWWWWWWLFPCIQGFVGRFLMHSSLPALFSFKWISPHACLFHSLSQHQSTVAKQVKMTVAEHSLTSCVWACMPEKFPH